MLLGASLPERTVADPLKTMCEFPNPSSEMFMTRFACELTLKSNAASATKKVRFMKIHPISSY